METITQPFSGKHATGENKWNFGIGFDQKQRLHL